MFKKNFAVYLGAEKEEGFTGFISEKNFFLIIQVEEGLEKEVGQEFLSLVKKDFALATFDNLADFEGFISKKITEKNLPAGFSIAAGFIRNNILYLKTIGQGEVYLYRAGKLVPIIKGDLSASGYLKPADLVVFTTASFMEKMGGEKEFLGFFDKKNPSEIVDNITPILKGKDDQGIIALLVQFKKEEEVVFRLSVIDKILNWYRNTAAYSQQMRRKKTITFLAVVIIFFILVWSVGFGYQRRRQATMQKKIQLTKSLILQKLNEADETSFFSISKSKSLIDEAKNEVEKLKKEVGSKKQIEELVKLIKEKENQILKKEEKKAEEFFDLAVDDKEARGDRLYLDNDLALILDQKRGTIYILSLAKKSLERKKFNEIKKAQLVASYQEQIIFYVPGEGLYKIDSEGKLKEVIKNDKDWGNIVDFWIYNGNLYLLDEQKAQIYKYLPTEEGYSSKTSYFKGGSFGLKDANSLAIDSSVYVGFADHIFKFTAGSQDEFKTSFPDSSVNITKIFTSKDLEKVYAWDKRKGAIYVLGKNGTYERQINSETLKKAYDFIVFQNSAYILVEAKIYKISLD
ncbi:MAG: hypothetical protein ACK4FL_03365 [Microgenomates group bacterium]